MSTTVYAFTDSNIAFGGVAGAPFSLVGRTAIQMRTGPGITRVDFLATGTACEVWYYAQNATPLDVTYANADGSSPNTSTPTLTQNAWTKLTIYTGLSDIQRWVTLEATNSNIYLDQTTGLEVTGSSPALALPSNFSANNYQITTNTNYFRHDGTCFTETAANAGQPCYQSLNPTTGSSQPDGSVRFKATCTGLRIYCYQNSQKIRLAVDGIDTGTVYTANATARWDWLLLSTSLSAGAEHEYTITACKDTGFFCQVMTLGGTANTTSTLTAGPTIAIYGDSISQGLTGTGSDSGKAVGYRLAHSAQVLASIRNQGVSGSSVHHYSSGSSVNVAGAGETRTADLTGLSIVPDYVVIIYGHNDAGQGAGALTAADFQTSYYNMMDALTDVLTTTQFFVVTILPTSNSTVTTNRSSFNSAIVAACTTGGNGSGGVLSSGQQAQITIIDTDNISFVHATDTSDGVHPNEGGYTKILTPILATFGGGVAGLPLLAGGLINGGLIGKGLVA